MKQSFARPPIKTFTNMENPQRISSLKFLPVSLFGGILGLCGLCFSWRLAIKYWQLNNAISETIGILAVIAFIILSITYTIKYVKYPAVVHQEFQNPVSVCFFATFIVCLLLLPGVLLPYFPKTSAVIWCIGTIIMIAFTWYVLRKWIDHRQAPENSAPAWILPVIGTLDIPIIGNQLNLPGIPEISLAAFGVGMIFSVLLINIIFSRLFFQAPIPDAIQPTLLILIAPLALAFSVYYELTGSLDMFSGALFYFNVFLFVLLGSKIYLITVACPFKISWWAVSFPLSAITFASLTYVKYHPDWPHELLAGGFLLLTTLVIIYLVLITIYQIVTGTFSPNIKI